MLRDLAKYITCEPRNHSEHYEFMRFIFEYCRDEKLIKYLADCIRKNLDNFKSHQHSVIHDMVNPIDAIQENDLFTSENELAWYEPTPNPFMKALLLCFMDENEFVIDHFRGTPSDVACHLNGLYKEHPLITEYSDFLQEAITSDSNIDVIKSFTDSEQVHKYYDELGYDYEMFCEATMISVNSKRDEWIDELMKGLCLFPMTYVKENCLVSYGNIGFEYEGSYERALPIDFELLKSSIRDMKISEDKIRSAEPYAALLDVWEEEQWTGELAALIMSTKYSREAILL